MNIWHDVSPEWIKPEEFIACIEISKGGKNKYELEHVNTIVTQVKGRKEALGIIGAGIQTYQKTFSK